ncbi:MurR/RpiR family transcriptional regulator [Clostridium sp. Sa3CUN1]|uniref:MurR/RpiR family transcriptional regulator n=1 Tax=Clostridium gallinarum TaxID=2762246 RepID=A0ABR8Q738_9CLOT|nr:MurR/RpiR family transcriptional regulator [Clostridium gallinarum]MBD7916089.1 MurR/RpiR family transcriptional regulator [Clostridium gallinarum]
MLTIEQLKKLNELDMLIYNYINENKEKALNMKIKDLADEIHVSNSSIIRFCKKVGCNGYSEFKIKYKIFMQDNKNNINSIISEDIEGMFDFFNRVDNEKLFNNIKKFANIIHGCDKVIFLGVGTSGILAQYGARFFTNIGKFSIAISDPFYPVPKDFYGNAVVIGLSVSGETIETINQINKFKEEKCKILSITNRKDCTLNKIADESLTYYMPYEKVNEYYNITTQVPVIYFLELLAKQVYNCCQNEDLNEYC